MPRAKNRKTRDRSTSELKKPVKDKNQAPCRSLEPGMESLINLLSLSPAVLYTRAVSDDFNATFVSSNVAELLGFEPEHFLEDREFWSRRIHPDDAGEVSSGLSEFSGKGHLVHHYRFLHRDGGYRWIRDEQRLIRDRSGNPLEIAGSWMDVTASTLARQELERHRFHLEGLVKERTAELENLNRVLEKNIKEQKKWEKMICESESHYRTLVENIPQKIFVKDGESVFRACNENFARQFNLTPEEIAGKTAFDLYPAEIAERFTAADRKVMEFNRIEEMEERLPFRGEDRIVSIIKAPIRDGNGAVTGLLGIYWDITEKKRTEEALRASEEQFRRMFDLSPVGAVMVGLDFRFKRCNEAFCRFLGYDEEELIGRTFQEVTHPEDRHIARPEMAEIAAGTRESARFQKRYLRRDGTIVWGEISIRGVRGPEGQLLFYLPIIDDITERKKNEGLIARTLSEKEVLLKEIHHRVKNNLQMVSSLLALQAAKFDAPLLREAFRESRSRIKSISLVHEKLYQSLNIAQINFRDYLRELVNDIFLAYRQPGISYTIDCCDFYPSIDKAIPLALIVNELVSNALKHAFPGRKEGTIRVELAQGENKRVILQVKDNGRGVPVEIDMNRTDSLGLQLVVLFVQQLDGTIELTRDEGSHFTVEME